VPTIVEEIRPDLYRAEIPLPRNPLKATNSYIIRSPERNLVIDTGMNREECRSALLDAFDQLVIDLTRTDFFVTHLHADHVGLAGEISDKKATIYFNEPDAEILLHDNLWALVCRLTGRHGFPAELVDKAIDSHPGQRYSPKEKINFTMVAEGDLINCGDYEFYCVHTPGHTDGHTCLYEPRKKIFFSGDHILGDITPNISSWLDEDNPLEKYFMSLQKVREMDIDLVLPGHRSLLHDCKSRIDQLMEHHQERLVEVIGILKAFGKNSAFEVASKMTWELVAECWDDFPLMQKWFATGEALAHLHYLEGEGKVAREEIEGIQVFALN